MTTPYTPDTLAERWQCSAKHIRNMIDEGVLPAFRLGGKLLRIRAEDVEKFECQNGGSPGLEENSTSHGTIQPPPADDGVIDLAQRTRKRQPAAPRLSMPVERVRRARQ